MSPNDASGLPRKRHLREGISLATLDKIAAKQNDNEAAALMQTARDRIFKKFVTAQ